jgi:hypothetical protein
VAQPDGGGSGILDDLHTHPDLFYSGWQLPWEKWNRETLWATVARRDRIIEEEEESRRREEAEAIDLGEGTESD